MRDVYIIGAGMSKWGEIWKMSLRDLHTEGPHLNVRYAMTRDDGLFGRPVRAEFEIHAHGLGYSLVKLNVPQFKLAARLFVFATPLDGQEISLTVAVSLHQDTDMASQFPLFAFVPRAILNRLIARQTFQSVVHDVQQDFTIWQHKRYVQPPILAEGDGPVGKYRLWARQFYRGSDQNLIT